MVEYAVEGLTLLGIMATIVAQWVRTGSKIETLEKRHAEVASDAEEMKRSLSEMKEEYAASKEMRQNMIDNINESRGDTKKLVKQMAEVSTMVRVLYHDKSKD